jgi:hypothetical protein
LPDFSLAVTNISRVAQPRLSLRSRVLSLDNRLLAERVDSVTVAANSIATLAPLNLKAILEHEGMVLVVLRLTDPRGTVLSNNLYWQGRDAESHRRLMDLPRQAIGISATARKSAEDTRVLVTLKNRGGTVALTVKITMLDERGDRVLPVYYDDNYVALLPGESRRIEVHCPASGAQCAKVALRGWNAEPREISVASATP